MAKAKQKLISEQLNLNWAVRFFSQITHLCSSNSVCTSRKQCFLCMHVYECTWNIMLRWAQQHGGRLHYDACRGESFNYNPLVHTVCSTQPNKLECQSQTHLGARCCTLVTLINDTEAEWEHDTVMDSPPSADKVRRVWNGLNLITENDEDSLSTSMEVHLSKAFRSLFGGYFSGRTLPSCSVIGL